LRLRNQPPSYGGIFDGEQLARGNHTELLQDAELVEVRPMLDDLAVGDAAETDGEARKGRRR